MLRQICTSAAVALLVAVAGISAISPSRAATVRSEGDDLTRVIALPYRIAAAQPSGEMEATMLALLNDDRARAGRPPLASNATLETVAREHGVEMFTFGFLSHLSRDGRTPWDRVSAAGIRPNIVGENLAYDTDVRAANQALMNSPGHRRNILFPDYHRVGVGVLDGGARGIIVVEDFTN